MSEPGEPTFEQEQPKEIKDAKDFPELMAILDSRTDIVSSDGTVVNMKDIVFHIGKLRMDTYDDLDDPFCSMDEILGRVKESCKALTRTEGLRGKVRELLEHDIKRRFEEKKKLENN